MIPGQEGLLFLQSLFHVKKKSFSLDKFFGFEISFNDSSYA